MSNTQPFDRLTLAQRRAVISIVSGHPPSRTARAAQVTDRCIRRWRKLPVFQEALADARRDFFSACRSHLNSSLAVAFETVLSTADYSWMDSDKLKAALFLLDRVGNSGMSALPHSENASTQSKSTA